MEVMEAKERLLEETKGKTKEENPALDEGQSVLNKEEAEEEDFLQPYLHLLPPSLIELLRLCEITRDIEKLHRVDLHIAHFVDIQKEWRVPESTKHMDSLGDVSSMLIDDYYMSMKRKLTNEDHKHWVCMPLSMKHVQYATKDAYAAYEIWSGITVTQDGLRCAMLEKSKKCGRTWGDGVW
ncbi:hypothetical protein D1007_26131 [Hordeum vulgare]|nr:hypothetical protein D1007_26131 [Hordeum vulgare]